VLTESIKKRVGLKTKGKEKFSCKRNFVMETNEETLEEIHIVTGCIPQRRATIRSKRQAFFSFFYTAKKSGGSPLEPRNVLAIETERGRLEIIEGGA